jgi:Flp pilus assembly protein TadG
MLQPLIRRPQGRNKQRPQERGFTMALVAVALVAIIAMAALSIDIGTLYQAKAEAQRAADAAALTAARVVSISGITGDPTNGAFDGTWSAICGGTGSPATLAAINVAQQNLIGGVAVTSANVTVNYGGGSAGASTTNCTGAGTAFGVNPVVTVNVQSGKLPVFFARVFSLFGSNFSNTSASASATAEVFNPSKSGSVATAMIPVQPRCVKPWIVPNRDPGNPNTPFTFVSPGDGSVSNPGVNESGGGVIGETFTLTADCKTGQSNCIGGNMRVNPPVWTGTYLEYVPALVEGNPGAVPSCSTADAFQQAIGGCDQTTAYTCGTPSGTAGATQVDLTENPVNPNGDTGDTSTATQCLINQTAGNDTLDTTTFPFQIRVGSGSPLIKAGVPAGDTVTTSNSIVTLPIYDGTALGAGSQPPVTIVGFLQVFINSVDDRGRPNVSVLNVAGCSNDATNAPVYGTSPVPIRLITPP